MALALDLADAADEVSLGFFTGERVASSEKPDGSPVTEADVTVEHTIRDRLRVARPNDAYLGEELGLSGSGPRKWIVDGIDGTKWFAAGETSWATLIALEVEDRVEVGVVSCAAQDRRWWAARGLGAFRAARGDEPERLAVSQTALLGKASGLLVPRIDEIEGWKKLVLSDLNSSWSSVSRPWHFWATEVASGELDGLLFMCGEPWDHAALVVLVEEAGGRFSDLWGSRTLDSRTALYSNAHLHNQILDSVAVHRPLRPGRRPRTDGA